MPDPEGSNDSTRLQNSTDSAPAPPPEPGPSTSVEQAPDAQEAIPNGVAPHASAAQPEQAFFGVRKQDANRYQHPQNVVFNDDYDKRLPEDPYCEETAPNARVWRMYVEEAAAFDAVFVGQARDGLDVMLVFAGLFSAVVTSFLVQVSQSLQADYTAMSAILLHDLIVVQLSIAEGPSFLRNITAPSVNPLQTFRPDSITVWVNGLWVVSLTASLVVALSAVLVKQWLHHYTSIPSGTPGARSHLRQYRFIGLQKWRVSLIIGLFPIIMHTSLALFLAGLMLFFIPLRTSLACSVGVITVALCLLYIVSNALPILFPQCPYQTPLTDFIHHTCLMIRKASHSTSRHARRLTYDVLSFCQHWIQHFLHLNTPNIKFSHVHYPWVERSSTTLDQLEITAVKSNYDQLSVDALDWLFNISSNPTVHSLVLQSIGGLPPDVETYARTTWGGQDEIYRVGGLFMQSCVTDGFASSRPYTIIIGYESVYERLNRSCCFVGNWSDMPKLKMNFDEPRLAAAAWAAGTWFPLANTDLRKFFCVFNKLKLHPLIWVKLVQSALVVNSYCHCFQVDSPEDLSRQDYAHIISLFLPASNPNKPSIGYRPGRGPVTLREALVFHLGDISESIQGLLLNMLSSLDDDLPPPLPARYRLLHKTAKFALHYAADELCASHTDVGSCRHLELLSDVLRILDSEYGTILKAAPCFLAPIFDLLRTIIDDTSICDPNAAGWQHPKLRILLSVSLSAIINLSAEFASCQPEFAFSSMSFHGLLQVPAHYLSGRQPLHEGYLFSTTMLIQRALAAGNEVIYQAFIDGGWMWMLAERCIADYHNQDFLRSCGSRPISAFIYGLQALGSTSAVDFFEYSQQPRNLIIIFVVIAPSGPDSESLLKLCPKGSSWWDTHRTTLDGIVNWCQAPNRDDLPFPLENFFNGKVVQTHKGAVFLDEELRGMFNLYRRRFEWAAQTIILGEAAPESLLKGDQSRLSEDEHELGVR